jgi:hypothetical protein
MTWQPIETAPRDGTPILVWPVKGADGIIPYVVLPFTHTNAGVVFVTWIEAAGEVWATFNDVTHWMPLPEPPK